MALVNEISRPSQFILQTREEVYGKPWNAARLAAIQISFNPLLNDSHGVRPRSGLVRDGYMGDSGKARVTQVINGELAALHPDGLLYEYGWNGASNSGHEGEVDGEMIALHQLLFAVTQEKATAILGKGKCLHPADLWSEIQYTQAKLHGPLRGGLIIDSHALVNTDAHRAMEQMKKELLGVGLGSTSSGVAEGYVQQYEKRPRTMGNLMENDWEKVFRQDYRFYKRLMGRGKYELQNMKVKGLGADGKRNEHPVGSEAEYIDRMAAARDKLKPYVSYTVYDLLDEIWHDPTIPMSFSQSQAGGLDPLQGIEPDITASRPVAFVGLADSTAGIIRANQVAAHYLTVKWPYYTIVGDKIAPYGFDPDLEKMYRDENGEFGKATLRLRGTYPPDLVATRHLNTIEDVPERTYLAVTHYDSPHHDIPIEVVVGYQDKVTGQEVPYRPHQEHWDSVEGIKTTIPGWDGKEVAKARTLHELDRTENAMLCAEFLGKTIAPVGLITDGPQREAVVMFSQR